MFVLLMLYAECDHDLNNFISNIDITKDVKAQTFFNSYGRFLKLSESKSDYYTWRNESSFKDMFPLVFGENQLNIPENVSLEKRTDRFMQLLDDRIQNRKFETLKDLQNYEIEFLKAYLDLDTAKNDNYQDLFDSIYKLDKQSFVRIISILINYDENIKFPLKFMDKLKLHDTTWVRYFIDLDSVTEEDLQQLFIYLVKIDNYNATLVIYELVDRYQKIHLPIHLLKKLVRIDRAILGHFFDLKEEDDRDGYDTILGRIEYYVGSEIAKKVEEALY